MSLYGGQLTGTIPTELAQLSDSLTGLYIHENYLEGTIPTELGLLTKLESLWIHLLSLTGTMPSEICQLTETGKLTAISIDCTKVVCTCGCSCPKGEGLESNSAAGRAPKSHHWTTVEAEESQSVAPFTNIVKKAVYTSTLPPNEATLNVLRL